MISAEYCGCRWVDDIHPVATQRLIAIRDAGYRAGVPMPCYHCGVGDQADGPHICAACRSTATGWMSAFSGTLQVAPALLKPFAGASPLIVRHKQLSFF